MIFRGFTYLLKKVLYKGNLEVKVFEPLGGNNPLFYDFRLICATNKDIQKEVKR
ncbi:sigma 54-interacting transcriptional regulator [Paramaledivibacter caminithermalis]|uniref:sigma 54-interacting transcriptional regulator n=1 Tax=Paramaledivibacter caminithermalis TaxID=191027 RepID=UPI001041CA43